MATYRAAHPADAQAPAVDAKAVWDRFRDDPAYRLVLKALTHAQQGLCLYCEQRLVDEQGRLINQDYQIEHVAPKSGQAGASLHWQSFALACGGGAYPHHRDESRRHSGKRNLSCGQHKDDQNLGPHGDPRALPNLDRFYTVDLTGRLSANRQICVAHGIPWAELDRVINEVLNLNCERLLRARRKTAENIRAWWVPLLKLMVEESHFTPQQAHEFMESGIAGRLQPDPHGFLRAFWSTERVALGAPADAWVEHNQVMFNE